MVAFPVFTPTVFPPVPSPQCPAFLNLNCEPHMALKGTVPCFNVKAVRYAFWDLCSPHLPIDAAWKCSWLSAMPLLGVGSLTGSPQSQLCTTFCSQLVCSCATEFSLIVSDHVFNVSRTQRILILSSKVPATSEWVEFQLSGYSDFEISHVFKILNKDLDLEMCIYPFTYFLNSWTDYHLWILPCTSVLNVGIFLKFLHHLS